MEGEVHVWHAVLDEVTAPAEMAPLLSDDERARAERFRFPRDRQRHIAAHAVLRTLLGRYLSVPPATILFQVGTHGKPSIQHSTNPTRITFNMSESHGHAMYAVSRNHEIGVDIEHIRDLPEMNDIVQRFFAPAEQKEFGSLPPDERARGFFNCWTRKEAVLKALGRGLTLPLNSFDVSLAPGQAACIVRLSPLFGSANEWTLHHMTPASGFAAAVAVQRQHFSLQFRKWHEMSMWSERTTAFQQASGGGT